MMWLVKPVIYVILGLACILGICFIAGCMAPKEAVVAPTDSNTDSQATGALLGANKNNELVNNDSLSTTPPTNKQPPANGGGGEASGSCPLPSTPLTSTNAGAGGLLAKNTNNKEIVNTSIKLNGDLPLTEQAMAYVALLQAKAEAQATANEWKRTSIIIGSIAIVLIIFMLVVFPVIYKDLKNGKWDIFTKNDSDEGSKDK